jgi:C-terminal processing protease CtpA/Prc
MAESGIAVGDRIMAVDGHPVRSQQELLAILAARQSVRLDIERKGRIATVEASTPAIQNQQGSQAAENDP